MARQFEKRYRLSETDDVLEKLRAILQDIDQRMDAVEQVKEAFEDGNRLDIDALLKAINEDIAAKSAAMQEVLEEVNDGFTADRIAETPEKRFTSDAEQQSHTDRINARATSAALGAHTSRTDNPHGVTLAQIGAASAAEVEALSVEVQTRGVPLGMVVHSAVPLEDYGFLLADGAPCTPVWPDLRAALIAAGSPFGNNGTDPLLPDEVTASRFRRAANEDLPVGTVQDDQMQRITGSLDVRASTTSGQGIVLSGAGAFNRVNAGSGAGYSGGSLGTSQTADRIFFDSANSPDARTGDETHPKSIAYLPYIKAFGAITIEGMADLSALFAALATEIEAVTGTDNTKLMTALRVRQAMKLRNSGVITLSGTSIEVTGIPAGVQRVTFEIISVSPSSGAYIKFELGSASGYPSTGYSGVESRVGSSVASASQNAAYAVWQANAGVPGRGTVVLQKSPDNRWVFSGMLVYSSPGTNFINGRIDDLVGDLSKIRFSTGSAATLSGDIVIWWEF